jgi:hypothetical protein
MHEIGIDKIRLSNVVVIGIDYSRFSGYYELGKGREVMDLKTGEVSEICKLEVKVKGLGDAKKESTIDLSLQNIFGNYIFMINSNAPKLFDETNINNIHTTKELKEIPRLIQEGLMDKGVIIDLEKSNVTAFEVNFNVKDEKFLHALKMISEAWKNEGHKVFQVDTLEGLESLKLKLTNKEIKVYDKTKHIREVLNISIEGNVIRIEVSTSKQQVIDRLLKGDTSLENFINNLENIQGFYRETIRENLKKPLIKYVEAIENEIVEALDNGKKANVVLNELAFQNKLVDLDIFASGVKKHYKKAKKGSPTSVIRGQLKRLRKVDSELADKLTGNLKIMEEFFKELDI